VHLCHNPAEEKSELTNGAGRKTLQVLHCIFSVNQNNILIISDCQSCLLSIHTNSFQKLHFPPYSYSQILNSLTSTSNSNKNIQWLWVSSHVGTLGNEMADLLVTSTKSHSSSYSLKIPFSDFLYPHRNTLNKTWLSS